MKKLNELQSYLTRLRGLMLTLILLCSIGSGNVWGTVSGSIATSISAGDQIVIVNTGEANELTGVTSNIGQQASYTTAPAGTYILTVEAGKSGSGYSFKDGSNKYLAYTLESGTKKNNNLYLISSPSTATQNQQCSWTVSINGTTKEATITNVYNTERSLKFNSDRFCCYTSAQTAIKIFKIAASTPTITPSVTELDWGTVNKGASLTTKTFTITGTNLTSAALVYAATGGGYTVSPSGKAGAAGTLASQTITVTPPSTATPGTYNYAVTVSGGGLSTPVSVAVKLTVQQTDVFIDDVHSSTGYEPATPHIEGGAYGTTPTLTDKATLTSGTCEQVHYHFVGWITSAKYEAGTTIAVGDLQTPTSATGATYYAVWAKQAAGGGGTTTESYGWETADDDSNWIISGVSKYDTYKKTGSYSGKIARGSTGESAVQFKNKVNVTSFSFQFLRQTTNNNYNVRIETSSNGSSWDDVEHYNMSEFSSAETWYAKSHTFDGKTALYVRFVCYTTTAVRWVDDISITYSGGVSYEDYIAKCCTSIGTISGAVSCSSHTSTGATLGWTMSATTGLATNGIIIKVYKASDNSLVHTSTALSKTATSYTVTDGTLLSNTAYYATLTTVSSGGSYCDGVEQGKSSDFTTDCWSVSESLSHTNHATGASTACPASNYVATYSAESGYVLPSSVSVSIGGVAKTQGTHYTWNSGTGTLTILAANITTSTGDIEITISSDAAGCSGQYTFAYGATPDGDGKNITDATLECFSQVSTTDEFQVTGFTIPTTTQYYWVGYNGYYYNSDLGTGSPKAKSSRNQFKYLPVASLQTGCDGKTGDGYPHAMAGAYGTLRIYRNSSADNLYVGFVPAGYFMRYGTTGEDDWANIEMSQSGSVWTTSVMDLTAAFVAKKFQIRVFSGASYDANSEGIAINNWTDGSSTISSMQRKTNSGDNWASGVSAGMRGFFRAWADNCANNGYCHFVPTHRVVFHPNYPGGGGEDQYSVDVSVEETNNSIALASAPSNPTGYTFAGWYDAADGGNEITTARTISAGATANIELYAHWTANTISLTLNKNNSDAGSTAGSGSIKYDATTGIISTAPTRTGYSVEGYYTNDGCTPANKVLDASGNVISSTVSGYTTSGKWTRTTATTLYAKWTPISYDVNWYVGGTAVGNKLTTGSQSANADYGTNISDLTFPTSSQTDISCGDKTFVGWTNTSSYTYPSSPLFTKATATGTISGETNLYAVFAEDGGDDYELVTSASAALAAGDKIIFASACAKGSASAMGSQNSNNRAVVSTTIEEELVIENPTLATTTSNTTNIYPFVLEANDGAFAIKEDMASGRYLDAPGGTSNNYLKTVNDVNTTTAKWTIEIAPSTNVATIVANGGVGRTTMQFNSTLFACYASASQSPVYIFRKPGAQGHTLSCESCDEVTLSFGAVSNGTMVVKRNGKTLANGDEVPTCEAQTVTVKVTPDAANHYRLTAMSISGVAGISVSPSTSSGLPTISEITYTVTIPADATGTLTITPTIAAIPQKTVVFKSNGVSIDGVGSQNVYVGEAPTMPAALASGKACDVGYNHFAGWTQATWSNTKTGSEVYALSGDDEMFAAGAAGIVVEDSDPSTITYNAVWADATPAKTYTKLSSNSFSTTAKYVIGAVSSSTTYYLYSCANTDQNNSWGYCTSDPATNAPIIFKLSGSANELVVKSTESPARYLKSLTTGDFQMSASSQTVKLKNTGEIYDGGDSYRLRYNSTGLRWYSNTTGNAAYFYEEGMSDDVHYLVACCSSSITLSDPSITDASTSGSTITFDKSSPVYTCDGTKTVTATLTLTAGYQASALSFAVNSGTVSVSPAISTPVTSSQVYTLTFAEDQNATLTTTATVSAKPLSSITLDPASAEVYVGQYAIFTVSYDPSDVLTKGYSFVNTPTYVTKRTDGVSLTGQLKLEGGRSTGPGASITETVVEIVSIQATADNSKTASVEMTVKPLPRVHFVDNVHGKEFADVVATISENTLNPNKTTKTSVDWSGSTANTCEEQHLHLVGWIDGDWAPYAAYMAGTGDMPDATTITGATGYFYAPGADINVLTNNGKTFYAVWAEVK